MGMMETRDEYFQNQPSCSQMSAVRILWSNERFKCYTFSGQYYFRFCYEQSSGLQCIIIYVALRELGLRGEKTQL